MSYSLPNNQAGRCPEFRLPPTHLALYRRLATAFVLMALTVAGLVFYTVFSRAEVIVLSSQDEVRAEFIADVSASPSGSDIAGLAVARTESLKRSFPVAAVSEADTHANGRVVIRSRLYRAQTLIATTRLLTPDGRLFRLKEGVEVPPMGEVEAEIISDGTGPDNDIGDSAFVIPGLSPELQERFSVETVRPVSGGRRTVRLVTQADAEAAAAGLHAELAATLASSLRQEALSLGAPVSGEAIDSVLVSRTFSPGIGSESEEVEVTVTVRTTAVFFDRAALDLLAAARLGEIVPFGRQLLSVAREATAISVEKADLASGRANIRVSAIGTAVLSAEAPALKPEKVTGVTAESAVAYLEQVNGVASASVRISPFWVGRLPNAPERISVEIR